MTTTLDQLRSSNFTALRVLVPHLNTLTSSVVTRLMTRQLASSQPVRLRTSARYDHFLWLRLDLLNQGRSYCLEVDLEARTVRYIRPIRDRPDHQFRPSFVPAPKPADRVLAGILDRLLSLGYEVDHIREPAA